MKIIADLHIHGKYSGGTSNNLSVPNLEKYANVKGIGLLGTGDFTHPKWLSELKATLDEDGSGILKTKTGFPFLLQSEISLIYTQDGKGRKVHLVYLAPNFDVVGQIQEALLKKGRIDYDGRPIFGIPCPDFVEMMKKIDKNIELIPAHIWTPWFSMFGANSGFDSVKECFKDTEKHIFAMETGLSSDPEMNWRLSQLDKYTLISNSDSHSFWPWRIGREANIFELKELTYKSVINTMKTRKGFLETIEVDPNFGKYHYTGHRNCNLSLSPEQSSKLKQMCPKCGKKLTVGVIERVEELADRPSGFRPKEAIDFKRLIPLSELLSTVIGKAISTQSVWKEYYNLVNKDRSEFAVLLDTPKKELLKSTDEKIASAIMNNRTGKIYVKPGYDGVYGEPNFDGKIEPEEKVVVHQKQTDLDEFL